MTRRLLAALPLSLLVLAGCGSGGDEVVNVDGEKITMEEFNQYLQTKRSVRAVVQGQVVEVPVAETLAFQALQELATQKLVMQMAADEGLMPTEAEVEAEIEFKKKINPSFLTELKAVGYSMGQIRREVLYSLCEERLLTRGIEVKKDEVDKIIKENPEQFIEPASVNVYEILALSEAKKAEVDAELRRSVPFKSVATKLTQNPQGPRKSFAVARLQGSLKTALESAPVNHTTDWLQAGNGWVKYFVDSRTEAKPMDMTAERRELLRRQIALTYGRQANDLPKQVTERLRSTDVRVSDDEMILKDMWKRFRDRLDKTAGEAETATATPPDTAGEG
jgi:hypothetical protein